MIESFLTIVPTYRTHTLMTGLLAIVLPVPTIGPTPYVTTGEHSGQGYRFRFPVIFALDFMEYCEPLRLDYFEPPGVRVCPSTTFASTSPSVRAHYLDLQRSPIGPLMTTPRTGIYQDQVHPLSVAGIVLVPNLH